MIKRVGEADAAKRRRAYIRSCAEVLRALATQDFEDPEAQDMCAFLAICLKGIYDSISESADVWDDKNYWKKAEALRERWRWSRKAAKQLEILILKNDWENIPDFLITLIPHFADVQVATMTRDSSWWYGAKNALQKQALENQNA